VSKRCSTPSPCKFDDHCRHRQVPLHLCNGHFWPNNTGEACGHYELHAPTEEELSQRLIRLAGAHE
jgi:hypothetical protein